MRARTITAAVVLVLGLLAGLVPSSSVAAPAETSSDQLQFFNISLRLVNADTYAETGLDWRTGFARMAEYSYLPDVISVLEVPLPKRRAVLGVIEEKLGADYGWVHSDTTIPACADPAMRDQTRIDTCGNTMIAFRIGRIEKNCEGCAIKSWVPFNQQQKQPCAQRGNATHVMARLRDIAQDKFVTVVPVHFDPGLDLDCLALNIKKLNDILEADVLWRNRPMTVVLGDFNEHPDPTHDDPVPAESAAAVEWMSSWRKEEQKACWYKRFSLQTDDAACDAGTSGEWSFPYSDTIGLLHGTGTDAICPQWTHSNQMRFGQREAADDCYKLKKKKRIDQLWVRYERSDGTAITDSSDAWRRAQILEGAVDRGWTQSSSGTTVLYSDHRMFHTRLSWCGAQASGLDTPCD